MPHLLDPVVTGVAAVLAGTHSLAESVGLAPDSAAAWSLAIALLVVAVRIALLPLVVHGIRTAHARARAMPDLRALQRTFDGRRDHESLLRLRDERRRVHAEHGVSRWSLAPALLQLPLVYALYRVVSDLAAGQSVGALHAALVTSAAAASVAGLSLGDRLADAIAHGWPTAVVLMSLALVAAGLSLATQRWFVLPMTDLTDQPGALVTLQHALPWLSAAGVLVAGAFVPAGLLVYWVANNAWTFAQQGLVRRFAPTPGSPAASRRAPTA